MFVQMMEPLLLDEQSSAAFVVVGGRSGFGVDDLHQVSLPRGVAVEESTVLTDVVVFVAVVGVSHVGVNFFDTACCGGFGWVPSWRDFQDSLTVAVFISRIDKVAVGHGCDGVCNYARKWLDQRETRTDTDIGTKFLREPLKVDRIGGKRTVIRKKRAP